MARGAREASVRQTLRLLVEPGFWRQVWQVWREHHATARAASLTFVTVLGLVPLTAIGVAVLEAVGQSATTRLVAAFLSRYMVPVESARVASYVNAFADNLRRGALGPVGIGLSILTAFLLFHNVESAFCDLWRSSARRSLVRKFTVFWTLATIGPVLLALSLVQGASVLRDFAVAGLLLPFLGMTLLLVLANRLLPNTWVPWRSAVVSGLVSSLLFESSKYLFAFYLTRVAFTNYHTVYGRLALLPILLVWIHLSWSAVLFGTAAGRVLALPVPSAVVRPDWKAALAVAIEVARAYASGRRAASEEELGRRLRLPYDVLSQVLEQLRRAGLLLKVSGDAEGYLPARPLERINAWEVAQAIDGTMDLPGREEFARFVQQVQETLRAQLEPKSLADLVDEPGDWGDKAHREAAEAVSECRAPPGDEDEPEGARTGSSGRQGGSHERKRVPGSPGDAQEHQSIR